VSYSYSITNCTLSGRAGTAIHLLHVSGQEGETCHRVRSTPRHESACFLISLCGYNAKQMATNLSEVRRHTRFSDGGELSRSASAGQIMSARLSTRGYWGADIKLPRFTPRSTTLRSDRRLNNVTQASRTLAKVRHFSNKQVCFQNAFERGPALLRAYGGGYQLRYRG
jgi:hypothetical protein